MARHQVPSLTLLNGLSISVGQRVIFKTGDEYFDGHPCIIFEIYKSDQDGRFYIAGELQALNRMPGPRGPRFENVVVSAVVSIVR